MKYSHFDGDQMSKPDRIPKELKRFVAAMLLIILGIALAAATVDLAVNHWS